MVMHRITLEEVGVEVAGSDYKDGNEFRARCVCACGWVGDWFSGSEFDWISHMAERVELADAAREEAEAEAVEHLSGLGWRLPPQTGGWTFGQIRQGMERVKVDDA